jgi:hypothetical protein
MSIPDDHIRRSVEGLVARSVSFNSRRSGGTDMRVLALWYPATNISQPTQETMAQMNQLIQEMSTAGVLVDTGGWDPTAPATVVTRRGGKVTVTDGPYAEAKEIIGGYAIMRVGSTDELVRWSRRFVEVAGDGRSVIRPIADEPLGH